MATIVRRLGGGWAGRVLLPSLAILLAAAPVGAAHSLGTAQAITPVPVGPGGGVVTFPDPGAKFLILRLTANPGSTGDRIRVTLPYGDDVLDLVAGQQVWTRPAPGASVQLQYLDNGDGIGGAVIDKTGRGTIIDLFQLNPFVDPAFNTSGLCGGPTPNWQDVDCLDGANPTQSLMKTVAESVGIFVDVSGTNVSSCSAALIDSDLILTAAHCINDEGIASGSFTLDFELACGPATPPGYNPKFYKVLGPPPVRSGFASPPASSLDYAVLQIDTSPGLSAPPLQMRPDHPGTGTEVFAIHHPRGAPKKVSRKPLDPQCQVFSNPDLSVVDFACDIDNGSSGSPLLDLAGRIVGVNDWRLGPCVRAQATTVIRPDLISPVPPPVDVDTMLVFDRSGSMSMTAPGGDTKLADAKEAAGLFYDLLRTDASHKAGLVTFSDTLSTDHDLAPITPGAKDTLLGVPHGSGGKVGAITAGGLTTIGGGLERAQQRLDLLGGVNTPTILLMTDGLQNRAPMVADVEPGLAGTRICAVGFGSEASLDGPLLTRLARDHGGLYTRADRGLDLKKFFALCFGNIFESGISMDPTYRLAQGQTVSQVIDIPVCGETSLTAVVAWETSATRLFLRLESPAGAIVGAATPGVTASSGLTWAYLRLPLPFNGERDGIWRLTAFRLEGTGEFGDPLNAEEFVAVSVVDGGPKLQAVPLPTLYTGDLLAPLVTLRDDSGRIYHADIAVELERPTEGTGNLLTRSGLGPAITIDGDQLDARTSTLLSLERDQAGPLIPTSILNLALKDDGDNDEGALEEDGSFGARLEDTLTREGHYTFHAVASYGEECAARREHFWSAYVSVGIDPGATDVDVRPAGTLPDGRERVTLVFTPRDRYGNYVGPGRGDSFEIEPRPGSEPLGDPTDLGDGSYEVDVAWDPGSGEPPGFGVGQPDRAPVDVAGEPPVEPVAPDRGRAWGLAFDSAIPAGSSNLTLDPGFGALVSYRHRLAPRASLVAGLGYAGFDGDGVPDLALFDLGVAGRYDSRPDPATRFFVKGGLGYYGPETDLGNGTGGAHLGVGVSVPIRGPAAHPPLELELSLEGHRLFDGRREPDFLRALVGLVVRH